MTITRIRTCNNSKRLVGFAVLVAALVSSVFSSSAHAAPVDEPTASNVSALLSESSSDNKYVLKNEGTNLCLSSNFNGSVYTTPCTDVIYHHWIRLPTITDGQARIAVQTGSSKLAGVEVSAGFAGGGGSGS